jgi:hypothetical protein
VYPGKHEQASLVQAITPSQLVALGIIAEQLHINPFAQGAECPDRVNYSKLFVRI